MVAQTVMQRLCVVFSGFLSHRHGSADHAIWIPDPAAADISWGQPGHQQSICSGGKSTPTAIS